MDAVSKSRFRPSSGGTEAMLTVLRLGALGAVIWGVSEENVPGLHGRHLAVLCLVVVAGAGWLAWLAARHLGAERSLMAAVLVLGAAGGALGALAPVAFTFLAIAALGAGIAFPLRAAVRVAAVGVASLVATAVGTGAAAGQVASGVLVAVAGVAMGASRRQYVERAQEAEVLLAERVRADAEADRAAALAERNRIGREVHDVLAHSLGAVAVQLEAAGALLEATDGDRAEARRLVAQARALAVDGLRETRAAVHALREEPVDLAEQLAALTAREGAELHVDGVGQPLPPDAVLALYRAAQEALTNARKHAPGSEVAVHLEFGTEETMVTVTNGPSPCTGTAGDSPPVNLATTGSGFGLQGMRERVEQVGGWMAAGPDGTGFVVEVVVPS